MLSYTECLKLDVKIVMAGFGHVSNAISMPYSSVKIKAISTKNGSMAYYTYGKYLSTHKIRSAKYEKKIIGEV